jgi:hypothetical protein
MPYFIDAEDFSSVAIAIVYGVLEAEIFLGSNRGVPYGFPWCDHCSFGVTNLFCYFTDKLFHNHTTE